MITPETTPEEIFHCFRAEMRDRIAAGDRIAVMMDMETAVAVFDAVQLVLLYGDEFSRTSKPLRTYAHRLQRELSTSPGIAESCRRGWLQQYNQVRHATAAGT